MTILDKAIKGHNIVLGRIKELEETADVKEYLAAQAKLDELGAMIKEHVKETGEIVRTKTYAFNFYKRSNTDWKGFFAFLKNAGRATDIELDPFKSETTFVKQDIIKQDSEEISYE